ncbi:uncharacterized protein LOC122268038 isoform X2 [Penaeus japonicus]|uniref:uncharacterized protein LOC122268038 isoform X2 n=1 Tax=Penaeus japonicus TaxID=27405 RepID=UPI001C716E6C|nr:uncharacterized protein LOC122268038 isoform X2 [Penaeus japonicus]
MASIVGEDDSSYADDTRDGRWRSRERVPSGSKTGRDASTKEYWKRVRSLSRENKQRQEARERHARRLELEERRRREHILAERKKERDTLMVRFLREPIRQRREAQAAEKAASRKPKQEDEGGETSAGSSDGRIHSSQSVPDLEEALRIVRGEDQALDARAQAFLSPTKRRRPVKEDESLCNRYVRNQTRPSRGSSVPLRRPPAPTRPFPPGSTDDVIRENQKPYPTRPPEELLARTRQLRGKAARDENDSLKLGTTKVLSDTFSIASEGRSAEMLLTDYRPPADSHIMVLPRPRLERRSSMPDLRDFRCVSSAVVYETIATLGRLGEARGLLVVPPRENGPSSVSQVAVPPPDIQLDKQNGDKAQTNPQQWARKMNKFIHEETQAVLQASPLLEGLSPSGQNGAPRGRRTQRKEWISKHTSVKTLQKKILPKSVTDSSSQTETIRPISAVHHRRNSIGSEGAESVYYDSLEEEDSRGANHKTGHQAFYVPITSEAEVAINSGPTLPARLSARLEERRASTRRHSKSNSLGVSSLALTGKRVHLIDEAKMAQTIASGEDTNVCEASESLFETNDDIGAESDSDILDSPKAKNLSSKKDTIVACSSEQDTDTSQSDIVQLSSEKNLPKPGFPVEPAKGHDSQSAPDIAVNSQQPMTDTYTQFSDHSNSVSSTEPLDEMVTKKTTLENTEQRAAELTTDTVNGELSNNSESDFNNDHSDSVKETAPQSTEQNEDIKIQVTDENGKDVDPNSDSEVSSPHLPNDNANIPISEEKTSVNGDNADTEISDHYESDTFQSGSIDNSINENISLRDVVENPNNASIEDLLSVSDSIGEVSENLASETLDDEVIQSSSNDIQEELSSSSTQEQYEIIGFTSSGKETLLESGFIDCDDPSLLPEPLSINCDEIVPTLIQTSRGEVTEDGKENEELVTDKDNLQLENEQFQQAYDISPIEKEVTENEGLQTEANGIRVKADDAREENDESSSTVLNGSEVQVSNDLPIQADESKSGAENENDVNDEEEKAMENPENTLDKDEAPDYEADNEELSDGTDSWDRVTVVRVSSGSTSESRDDTPDLDNESTDTVQASVEEDSKNNSCQEPPPSPQDLVADVFNATDNSLLDEIFRNVSPHDGNCSPVDESSSGLSTIEEDDEHLDYAQDDDVNPLLEDTVVGERSPSTTIMLHEEKQDRDISTVEMHGEGGNASLEKEEVFPLSNGTEDMNEVQDKENETGNEETDDFGGGEPMMTRDDETLNDEDDILTDVAENSLVVLGEDAMNEIDAKEGITKMTNDDEVVIISDGEDDIIIVDGVEGVITKEENEDIRELDEDESTKIVDKLEDIDMGDEERNATLTEGETDTDIHEKEAKLTLSEHEVDTNVTEEKSDVTVTEGVPYVAKIDEKTDLTLAEGEADISVADAEEEASIAEGENLVETGENAELTLAEDDPDTSVLEEKTDLTLPEAEPDTSELEKKAELTLDEDELNTSLLEETVELTLPEREPFCLLKQNSELNLAAEDPDTTVVEERVDISLAEEESETEERTEIIVAGKGDINVTEENANIPDEGADVTVVEEEVIMTQEVATVTEEEANLSAAEDRISIIMEESGMIIPKGEAATVEEGATVFMIEEKVDETDEELIVDEEEVEVSAAEETERTITEEEITVAEAVVTLAGEEVAFSLDENEAEIPVGEELIGVEQEVPVPEREADLTLDEEVANVLLAEEEVGREAEVNIIDIDSEVMEAEEEAEITMVKEEAEASVAEEDTNVSVTEDVADVSMPGKKEDEEVTMAEEVTEVTVDEEEMNLSMAEEETDISVAEEEAGITMAEESLLVVAEDADELGEQCILKADDGDDATTFEDIEEDSECEETEGEMEQNNKEKSPRLEGSAGVSTTDIADFNQTEDLEDIDEETVIEDMTVSTNEEVIENDDYDEIKTFGSGEMPVLCSPMDENITDDVKKNDELDPDKDIDETHGETIGDPVESDHDPGDRDEACLSAHHDSDGGESLLMSDATLDTTEPETKAEYEELLGSVLETEIKAEYEELVGSEKENSDMYQDMIDNVEKSIEEKVYVSEKVVARSFNSFLMKSDTNNDVTNHPKNTERNDIQHARTVWESAEASDGSSGDHTMALGNNDNNDAFFDNENAEGAHDDNDPERNGGNWAASVTQVDERSRCEVGSLSVGRQAEACAAAPSSASSDDSPRERSEGDHGEAVAAANSPSSDSGVVEMAGKTAHSPSDASVEEAAAEDHNPRGRDAQDSSRSEESVRSAPPNRRTSSKQAKDRANRITSGRRRSSSGCGRASLDGGDVTALHGWTTFTAPGDDSDNDSKPRRRHWEAPRNENFQNLPPQVDSDGASMSRHRMVQEYLDSLQNHQISKDGSPRCTVGSGPHSLNDFPTDNLSEFDTSDSGDMSYSERLLRVLESRRSRRQRPRSSNIDGEDTPTRYRPSALSALDVFLTTLSRYRGGQQLEGDPPRDPTPPPLPQDGEDNVTVQVKTGPRQHDVRVSSRRQVRLVVNVGSPARASDSGCVADSSQSERKTKRTGPVGGGSPTGRRRPTRNVSENRAPPSHARDNAASDPEVDQLLSDVREYLNKKLSRQSGAEESGDQVPPGGIVVEGNNIEKCFTERPPGGGRVRLYPKHRPKQEERRQRMAADPKQKERQRIQQSIHAINALLKQYS